MCLSRVGQGSGFSPWRKHTLEQRLGRNASGGTSREEGVGWSVSAERLWEENFEWDILGGTFSGRLSSEKCRKRNVLKRTSWQKHCERTVLGGTQKKRHRREPLVRSDERNVLKGKKGRLGWKVIEGMSYKKRLERNVSGETCWGEQGVASVYIGAIESPDDLFPTSRTSDGNGRF